MAFFFNDYSSSGLNDISSLTVPLDPSIRHSSSCPSFSPVHTNTENSSNTTNPDDTMSDVNKTKTTAGGGFGSRIPKINFGFRNKTKNGGNTVSTATVISNNDPSSWSGRSTPEGCEAGAPVRHVGAAMKSSAGSSPSSSNGSSPTVGRSKSLRLPRSNYIAKYSNTKTLAQQKVDYIHDEAEDFYPDDLATDAGSQFDDFESQQQSRHYTSKTGQTGSSKYGVRARSSTITAASSNSSSRESSPGGLTMSAGSSGSSAANGPRELERTKFGVYGGGSLSQSDTLDDYQDSGSQTSLSRRSQSFSSKHQTRLRAGSFGVQNRLQPPSGGGVNQPSRRSKTPTALFQRTGQTGQTSGRNGTSKLALSRTSSLGKMKQYGTGVVNENENSSNAQPSKSQNVSQRSRRSSGEQRGKRPSSVVISENAGDLNALAQELSQADADCSQPEVKTLTVGGGRVRPASSKTLAGSALNTRRSHSSIGYSRNPHLRSDTPDQQNMTTSSSSLAVSSSTTTTSAATKSKYLTSVSRIEKQNRPTSARDYYPHGRKDTSESRTANSDEVPDSLLEGQIERAHSVSNFGRNTSDGTNASGHVRRQSGGGGRSSAPSSGRSTPIQRSASGNKLGKDMPDGGVVSSTTKATAGLPPRTPYARAARTKATPMSTPSGINELEGSVLLEADDYRRISNDVKSLKTALLKLKRELQVDLEGKSPSPQTPQTPRSNTATPVKVGRSVTTPGATPGPIHSDLRKKLKTITNEKDKALEEVSSCRKELKVKSERISSLMLELEKERKKNAELTAELGLVEGHRNRLLDKVERLHADKHNLEARLNTLERASIYELTLSEGWLDELDGGDCDDLDIMDPSLGAEGTSSKGRSIERKEMTESEIGDFVQSDGGEGESSEPESAAMCSAPVS